MRAVLSLAFLVSILLFSPRARAQDRGERPWRADLSVTGNYFAGSFQQLQLLGRAFVSYSAERGGNDLLLSGLQVWQRSDGAPFVRVADDLVVSDIPFYYVHPKVYMHGFARFARSSARLVDARVSAGGGVGVTPIRTESVLFRASLGAQVEHARFADDAFNLDVAHDGGVRTVPRLVLFSNGWYRVKGTPVSLRYLGDAMLDPRDPRDNRQFLDAGLDVKLGASGWSARTSALWTRDSVVPEGVSPSELRAGVGFAYTTPAAKAAP
jgi:hypothetical protein